MKKSAENMGRTDKNTGHDLSCRRITAIRARTPPTRPQIKPGIPPPGRILQVKLSTILATANPTAHHPSRVLGRLQREELE
jgi:hypothetical protein